MQRLNKPFYSDAIELSGGFTGYMWMPIFTTTNYADNFIATLGSLSPADKFILDSFTQQYIRSVEQAVSTYAKPVYYKGGSIAMNHVNWYKGYVPVLSTFSMMTTWVTESGDVHTVDYISKASKALGIYIARIKQVANCTEPYFVDTPKYGKVQLYVEGLPTITQPLPRLDMTGVNISNLTANKIYFYNADKQPLTLQQFYRSQQSTRSTY